MNINLSKSFTAFLLLILFSFKLNAQIIDVELLNLNVSPNPIIADQPYTISFDIRNNGPNTAGLIVIQIAQDTFLAQDSNIINSPDLISFTNIWTQEPAKGIGQLKFSSDFTPPPIPGRIPNGGVENFQVTLMAPANAVPPENINVDVIDFNLTDSNPNNSNSSVVASVVLPPAPEYTMTVDGMLGTQPIDVPVTYSGGGTYSFELENFGGGFLLSGESVSINTMPGFVISNPQITFTESISDPGSGAFWGCIPKFPATAGFDCQNAATSNGMYFGDKVVFSGTIDAVPGNEGVTGSAVSATVFGLSPPLDSNPGDDTAGYDITVSALAAISVSKTIISGVSNNFAEQGSQVGYQILVDNTTVGTSAQDVVISDILPTGIEFVPGSFNQLGTNFDPCNYDALNRTITCSTSTNDIPEISSQDGVEFLVDVTGPVNLSVTNSVSVSASNAVSDVNTNAPAFTIGLPSVDLDILKDAEDLSGFSQSSFLVGENFNYKLTVHNNGINDTPIGEVIVTDTIPTGLQINNTNTFPNSPDWNCSNPSGQLISCTNISAITSGSFADIYISVNGPAAINNVVNSADVALSGSATVIDNNLTDNSVVSLPIDILAPALTTLSINKSAIVNSQAVSSIARGSSFDYQIDVTNTGGVDAPNVQVVDVMPAEVVVNNFTGTGWTCSNVAQTYTCDFVGPLATGATTTLSFNVTDVSAININQIQNDVDVTADNATLSTAGNTVLINNPGAMVKVHQNPDPVIEGQGFNILVEVTNTSASDLNSVVVVNTLPTGFSYGTINKSVSKAGLTSTCNVSGQDVSCSFDAAITVGSTGIISIPVNAIQIVDPNTTYTNSTSISGAGISDMNVNTNLNVITAGNAAYSLDLVNFSNPVDVGQQYTYFLFVENLGTSLIDDMHINFNMTPNLTIHSVASDPFNCTVAGSLVNCNSNINLNLGPGARQNVISIVVSSPSFTGNLTVQANSDIAGSLLNSTSQTTTIQPLIVNDLDIAINKVASQDRVLPNSQFVYLLSAINQSTIDATNVVITDNLPAGVTLNSINTTEWNCNGTSTIICSNPVLSANSMSTIELSVTAPSILGSFVNTAQIETDANDTNVGNDSASATVQVVTTLPAADADLKVTKSVNSTNVTSGNMFDWNIEVENLGPGTASNVVIEDLLPSGFELVSVTSDSMTDCQSTVSSLNCQISSMNVHDMSIITVTGNATLDTGLLENTVNVSSDTTDPDNNNNQSTTEIFVDELIIPEADLSVSVIQGESVQQGKSTTFDVIALNSGPDVAVHPVLNVSLTGLINTVSVNSSSWSCQVNGFNLSCSLNSGTLGVQQQSTMTVEVLTEQVVVVSEDLVLSVEISSDTLDPDLSNNTASNSIVVTPTPTEGEIETAMQNALGGTGGPQVNRAIESVSSYCEIRYFTALEGLCEELFNIALDGDGGKIKEFMEEVTPNEVIGQSSSAAEIVTAQFRNIDARLSQLRGGTGGFSMAGLNARYGDGNLPLGMLAYLNQTESETDGVSQPNNDFISPWGFFVNGTISMGERDPTSRELGFDFETFGITAGIDYRLDSKKVIGVALGYASFDSEISDDSAKLESTGVTLTGYGSFYINDNFYMDARISYGRPDFDQERHIDVILGDTHIQRTSVGSTSANQYTVAMSAGYHFNKNSWNITPNASVRYINTDIDGFEESGAGDFDFAYGDQQIKSLVWSAGVSVSKAISLKKGVITPQFDFNYNYESENDGGFIEARFIQAPVEEIFIIETDSPDSSYGSAGIGLVYVTSNRRQAYINYRTIMGLDGFSRGTINLGARFEF